MDRIDKLKYVSTEQMFEGILVEIHDASVTIDIKGRLGQLKIPRRMIISEYDLEIGQEVGFLMSYPEVLEEEPNAHYVDAIKEHQRRRLENEKRREAESREEN
ncbi:CBO2463/CBO2479 domain-containing protein [Enterococcus xiangfangensis]|uniref:CBO2463/CBO2479 domain-containing protein n=1 Tax=Enterococcus xiangfangensis TaxID=1296537 RepID=A0ABU3F978_9ENTE|nr:CBO2463/CBO2479 domain-containing protein [Enterococcus xiangfangensis]MDT2759225.1 CBO2463/CBO2479 domain-containing protein [Enterococcus xiangfangensis]